jgi:gamma-glutamyl-gamma-aminobutyrate hydrolase PuuD
VVGVQWHPEHKALENPLSIALFAAFGRACSAPFGGDYMSIRAA